MDDDVVHLHLEHRVVQRLLGRFTAQGFVLHDLSRACLTQTSDAIPRVILLGRLSPLRPGRRPAARGAGTGDRPLDRDQPCAKATGSLWPGSRGQDARFAGDGALACGRQGSQRRGPGQAPQAAARDIEELLPHLESRGRELAGEAVVALHKRADQEAKAMRTILEEQKKRVADTAEQFRDRQLWLDFNDDEQRQLESNKRHWEKRLHAIDRELATEPERIRALYEVKAQRIEPVGLVYLWPVSG